MTCPTCRTDNAAGARFCMACGSALPGVRPLEGERKYATVLFADVAGSTALAERLGPEAWAEVMNGAFGLFNEAVTRYGGTVGRLMGDAVLAFFGAPQALEDHAERAVHAGLAIVDATAAYGARVRADLDADFSVRVGISTGLVVFTTVGDAAKAEYTAMGDAANVAAHLQARAPEGGVLIAASTLHLTGARFEVEAAGAATVKGRRRPVDTYRVLGVRERLRGREGVTAPLVGRDAEVRALRERVDAVRAGRGGWVLVRGEAGLGKSRLLAEVRDETVRAGHGALRWLEGRGVSFEQTASYHPWAQLIRAGLRVEPHADAAAVRARLAEPVGSTLLADTDRAILATVLAVEDDAARAVVDALDPQEVGARVAGAVRALLRALAAEAPLVAVLDDVHWADAASVALLVNVADLAAEAPVLWVTLLRPDRAAPAAELAQRGRERFGDELVELELRPLAPEGAAGMLGHLLAGDRVPDEVRGRILERAEGNPFFLEEVIRALRDAGYLGVGATPEEAGPPLDRLDIPDTVMGLLSARLDRLPAETKQVAQTAAVIGRTFEQRILARVCLDAPPPERIDDVEPHLGTLAREEVVRERPPEPERIYTFKHALSQEAAYGGLLLRRRRDLHRRTLRVLEAVHGDAAGEHATLLAHHAHRAEAWLDAATYSARAAERSLRLFALGEAVAHFDAALDALEAMPDPPSAFYIDVVLDASRAAVSAGRHESLDERARLKRRIEQAVTRARALGDEARLARALVAEGNLLMLSGTPSRAMDVLLESSELATKLDDEGLMLLPFFMTTEHMVDVDPRGATERFGEVLRLARTVRHRGVEAHALAAKALAHARIGEFAQARADVAEALELAPHTGSNLKEADVYIVSGMVFYELDEVERGLALGTQGRDLALSVNGFECACTGYFVSGYGRLRTRRLQEALRDFRRSADLGADPGLETWLNLAHAGEALTHLETGGDDAAARLQRNRDHARALGDAYGAALMERELGLYWLRNGEPARAHEQFASALAYHRRAGMRPYLAKVARLDAEALTALGRADEARALAEESARLEAALREELARPPLARGDVLAASANGEASDGAPSARR